MPAYSCTLRVSPSISTTRVTARSRNARSCETRTTPAGERVEEPLEPREPCEVEVVRRLVEQEDVEAGEQDGRERRPGRLAAGERRHLSLGARPESDVRQHRPGAAFEVLAAEGEEAVKGVGVDAGQFRLVLEARRERIHRPFRVADARAPREVAEHGLAGARLGLLWQEADGAAADDLAGVGGLDPGEHAEQRRLADPVRADDPDPVAG